MKTSEIAMRVENSPRSRSSAGAIAGLAALIIGIIANIGWDLAILVGMFRLAFAN
ncbi:MAG TPA: hypothetical protein VMU17_04670 [Elusimicrobiota bacterium]|nr:hypothetical protein [Elusimicrobiota bacterium]